MGKDIKHPLGVVLKTLSRKDSEEYLIYFRSSVTLDFPVREGLLSKRNLQQGK